MEPDRLIEIIFDRMPMGIAILDRDLVLRRCNPTWAAFIARYTPTPVQAVVPGAHFLDLAPGSEETSLVRYKRALTGERVREEGVPMRSNGIVSYWDVVITPLVDDGEVVGVLDVTIAATERQQAMAELKEHRDSLERMVDARTAALSEANAQLRQEIGERSSAEAALRASEEKYRELVESANSIILRMDTAGRVTFFNEFAQRFFGYDEEEILGRSVVGTIVPYADSAGADLARLVEDIGKNPEAYGTSENENVRKNGERVWVAWTNRAILDANGRTAEVLCVGNDITAQRRAADELRHAHEQLEERVEERTAALSNANTVLQREIAERKRIEEELRERVAFENLITTISTRFINLAPEDIDYGINEALSTIGEFVGVDRSYVFIYSPDGKVMDNTHEWCAKDVHPERENLQGIPSDSLPWWTAQIRRLEVIHIPLVQDLPPEAIAERDLLASQAIQSLIVVPLAYAGKATGFLGFDSVRTAKTWTEESVKLLRIVGEIISNAVERKRAADELKQAYQTLELRVEDRTRELYALLAVQQAISSRLDPDDLLQLVADEAMRLTNSEFGIVFLVEGDSLRVATLSGAVDRSILGARVSIDNSLAGTSVRTGLVQKTADAMNDPRMDATLARVTGTRTALMVPLLHGNRAIGGIALANKAGEQYGPDDERRLMMLAAGAAIELENARLYQEEQERREEAEQRRQVAEALRDILGVLNSNRPLQEVLDYIVLHACRLLGTDAGALFRLAPESGILTIQAARGLPEDYVAELTIPLGTAAVGRAVGNREPVVVHDARASFAADGLLHGDSPRARHLAQMLSRYRSLLAVPLVVKDEVYGGIVMYYPDTREFGEDEVALAATFGDEAALAIENARLRAQAEQTAVAAERSRLARDLHDAVTQTLFSASLIAEVLPRLWERNPDEGRKRLEELRQLTRGALAEMRTLLLELRPSALTEAALPDLLRQLAEALTGRARIPTTVTVDGQCALAPEIQVPLYRIAQEALNNVAKHSGASSAAVHLECGVDEVRLTISDDGRGFDPVLVGPNHLGLGIMMERAETIGADVEVNSEPGKGTRVVAVWRGTGSKK